MPEFAGICRVIRQNAPCSTEDFRVYPKPDGRQKKDNWQTKGRIIRGITWCLPAIFREGFGSRQNFPEEKAIFPKLSRTVPEEMGVFPEELPKRAPKKVQYFRQKAGNWTDKFPKNSQTLPGPVCPLSDLCLPLDSEEYQLIVRHSPNDWRTELLQMIIADIVNATDKIAVLLAQRFPDYLIVFTKCIKGPFTNPKNLHRILGTYPIPWIIKLCFMQLIH